MRGNGEWSRLPPPRPRLPEWTQLFTPAPFTCTDCFTPAPFTAAPFTLAPFTSAPFTPPSSTPPHAPPDEERIRFRFAMNGARRAVWHLALISCFGGWWLVISAYHGDPPIRRL
eukprot:scaffold3277_cov134-Isochrysis_galbana.AAC.2